MKRSIILLAALPLLGGCAVLTLPETLENIGWFALGATVASVIAAG